MLRRSLALTLLLAAACAAPRGAAPTGSAERGAAPPADADPRRPAAPAVPTPWTESFLGSAVLVADTIQVEGPAGLFEHAVSRADDALYTRKVVTTEEGLLQVVRPRPGAPALDPIRAQLDAWQLAAFRELIFLERLDPAAPVIVTASGEAVWRDTDGNEQREARLVFRGEIAPAGARAGE